MWAFGRWRLEVGAFSGSRLEVGGNGMRNLECGLRPIGAYAYAPVGMRKIRAKSRAYGNGERQRREAIEWGNSEAEGSKRIDRWKVRRMERQRR